MNTLPLQKTILRTITALCLAAVIFSLGASVQARPSAAANISSIGAFEQVAAGTGWILFDGKLYWTEDNGAAWTDITPSANIQAVDFLDASRGSSQLLAVASVMDGYALAETSDGGKNWQTRVLALPALTRVDAPIAKVYMGWRTDLHGWLVFKLATGSNFSHGILFVTFDGGDHWQAREIPLGEAVTFSDANNGWVSGGPAGDQTFRTRDGGLSWQSAPFNGDQLEGQNEAGWKKRESGECAGASCWREVQLLATRDGVNWESMRLPNGQTFLRENFSVSDKLLLLPDADTKAYVGQGFDTCEIPSLTRMQTWWNSSPYSAVNLYIGGIARACSNSALNASYLSQMNAQGWRFIPTWVGLQASCSGYINRMSSNETTAYNQGVAEANAASTVAQNLGLTEADGSGTVIYYDLEAYSGDTICRNAAKAFINGWTSQLRARGNLAGVYGSPCNATDWTSLANVPDALWLAHWVESSYSPTATVWTTVCLPNTFWPTHQRLRQYAGGHNETWGALTLNIDSNVLDGPLTVPNGTGDASAPGAPSNPNPAHGSALERANDTWLTWKTNGDTCSLHVWGGALDTTVATPCSNYHLGAQAGGAYSWQVTSTNGFGSTLGPIWTFGIKPASPSGLSAVPASSTRVNLTWTVSTDAVDSYLVYADGAQVGSAAGTATSFQVQNLACNSSHSFYVKAVREGVQSNASNTASATTSSCAPVLVSPLGGVVVDSLQPTFNWQAVDGASYYQIQVSTYSSFSIYAVNAKAVTTTYTRPLAFLANKLYYWRVRAIGTFGYGDWSASSFTTPNPPPAPALVSPANNGLVTDYTPRLDWKDVLAPTGTTLDHYQIQVATDLAFTNLLHNETVAVSEFTPLTEFLPNTRNYWRVRSVNSLGHSGAWSAVWYFRAAMLPPNLVSPTDGTPLPNRRPLFDWDDAAGASSYTLQISTVTNFATLLKNVSVAGSIYSMPSDLPANATLYWRVRANGVNGPSLWTNPWGFHTGNPPSVPLLLSPLNNTLTNDLTPRLTWRAVTVPAGTTFDHYQVQVATDIGFIALVVDQPVTTLSPSEYTLTVPLLPNTKYYWRVHAVNASGEYSAWSAARYFRTSATAVFEWIEAFEEF